MFDLKLKLFLCLLSVTKLCFCVKIYKVRRINDSSYLVTSYPEMDYTDYLHTFHLKPDKEDKVISVNSDKRSSNSTDNVYSSITIVDKKDKYNSKIPAAIIEKARQNYFKNVYGSMKKTNTSQNGNIVTDTPYEISNQLDHNLKTARKLVSVLIVKGEHEKKDPTPKLLSSFNNREEKQRNA